VAAWRAGAGEPRFDAWIVSASLAGHPAAGPAEPMFAHALALVDSGAAPNFSIPIWADTQQAFQALVHQAAVTGDSARVLALLRRADAAPPTRDPSDPVPSALRTSLEARLALLAGDTARAVVLLERAVQRTAEPFIVFYPLLSMAPQRMLLAELLAARGDAAGARRWLRSFEHSWSLGDLLFARRAASLRARVER
jgi:hypothetical protein